jgi:hypothetical protein
VLPQDREEATLEAGVGAGVAGERLAQLASPAEWRDRVEPGFECLRIDEVEAVGLVDRGFERIGGQRGGQVDQGEQRATEGDCSFGCGSRHWVAAVHADALEAGAAVRRNRDLDGVQAALTDAPQCRSTFVRKRGAITAGEDGGHEPSVPCEREAPHAIDAGPLGHEPAAPDAMPDRIRAEAKRQQLRAADNSILPTNERPDGLMVDRGVP